VELEHGGFSAERGTSTVRSCLGDAGLYAASAVFACFMALHASIPLQRSWGRRHRGHVNRHDYAYVERQREVEGCATRDGLQLNDDRYRTSVASNAPMVVVLVAPSTWSACRS
jgi:hypothetical protein